MNTNFYKLDACDSTPEWLMAMFVPEQDKTKQ